MCLAATEVGLQVVDGGCVFVTGKPTDCAADKVGQTFGEVSAAEEFDCIGVTGILFTAEGDLVKVSREFGRGEVPGGDVVVGRQHFAPGLEPGGLGIVDGGFEGFLIVLVGGNAAQVEAYRVNFVGFLGGSDELEQSLTGV